MAITLPPSRILGDSGHVTDHATIRTALSDLDTGLAAKAPSANPTFTGTVALPTTTTLNGVTLSASGLTYITSATASAAATLSVNNCFTSTYDTYLVMWDGLGSADAYMSMRLRASASDNTAANYNSQILTYQGTTVGTARLTGQTTWTSMAGNTTANTSAFIATLFRPALAVPTSVKSSTTYNTSGGWGADSILAHTASTAFDGFTLYPASGTITGIVRVYGYKNS